MNEPIKLINRKTFKKYMQSKIGKKLCTNKHIINKINNSDYSGSDIFYQIIADNKDDFIIATLRMKASILYSIKDAIVDITTFPTSPESTYIVIINKNPPYQITEMLLNDFFIEKFQFFKLVNKLINEIDEYNNQFYIKITIPKPIT